MWKKILVAVVVLASVLAGGLYLMFNNLAKELRAGIVTQGSASLGVTMTIDDAEIVTEGIDKILKLSRVSVANPSGFSGRHAIRMGEVWIRYDDRISNARNIVVREVIATGIEVAYERRGNESNLDVLQRNAVAERAKPVIVQLREPPKIIVDYFTTRAGKMTIRHDLLGAGKVLDGALTPVNMSGVGRREDGVIPTELAVRLVTALVNDANRSALEQLQRALTQPR
jgi:hypothetical protein